MKPFWKAFSLLLFCSIVIIAFGYFTRYRPANTSYKKTNKPGYSERYRTNNIEAERLKFKAVLVRSFVSNHSYENAYCFLIDMHIPSGEKRFFVYSLSGDSVIISGLVTHGSGSARRDGKLTFSNIPGSNATSLGKYRIAGSYNGKFGLAYKLYGLDSSNSNAFNRFVVLHSHSCVPDDEVYPFPICESWGCPTVSPDFLQLLKIYIEKSSDPVLLHIFY